MKKKVLGLFSLLSFLGFIAELNARSIDIPDKFEGNEDRTEASVNPRFDEDAQDLKSGKDQKSDFSSTLNENVNGSIEEIEAPESFVIINTADKLSSTGGGVRLIDSNVISEQIIFPSVEAPWWQRWWNGVTAWLFGDNEE